MTEDGDEPTRSGLCVVLIVHDHGDGCAMRRTDDREEVRHCPDEFAVQ